MLKSISCCILLVFFGFFLSVYSQPFTLTGTIEGKDTGIVTLYYKDTLEQDKKVQATIKNGSFNLQGFVNGGTWADIRVDSVMPSFFIEPGNITLFFTRNNWQKPVIKGSLFEDEKNKFENSLLEERKYRKLLNDSLRFIENQLKEAEINAPTAEKRRSPFKEKLLKIDLEVHHKELAYIHTNISSYYSLYLLLFKIGTISVDSVDILYAQFPDKIKNSSLGYDYIDYYRKYRKAISSEYPFDRLKINEPAPSFSIYNKQNIPEKTLTDYKGKMVLIESWGITCLPCLKANPFLEKLRQEYGKDKLEIISLLTTNKGVEKPQLVAYINKNRFNEWLHIVLDDTVTVSDPIFYNGNFSNYDGLGVPRTILLDQYGIVVYKHYGYSAEEHNKLSAIIKKMVK